MNPRLLLAMMLVLVFAVPLQSLAGTIDPLYNWAWSDEIGWINFSQTGGTVTITDTALTGYIWNENYGWINLAPTEGGVINTTAGDLAGFAWGEYVGWIDFDNAMINASGKFTGTASGSIIGTLSFDCTQCDVRTDWRPTTVPKPTPTPSPTPPPVPNPNQEYSSSPNPSQTPPPVVGPGSAPVCKLLLFSANLKLGSQGQEVKQMQAFLRQQGLFNYPTDTGYFGQITKNAVMQFQEKYAESILKPFNLSQPTGNWYPATMAKANSMLSCQTP